ncbi:hypothetical protein AXG93_2958s1450 [Marchantia polymorpha subsp. ruderalis]|uniref:Uncharacterized protein n=1 Tax=Marchantia polymorpha subsp. ruderalis TaxID=1480154 RepID=A0A176VFN9_MARPO|nr:hypothetical protein AXG93_2958s1450 [Marchantia polymorpha subsp. ruderalis]
MQTDEIHIHTDSLKAERPLNANAWTGTIEFDETVADHHSRPGRSGSQNHVADQRQKEVAGGAIHGTREPRFGVSVGESTKRLVELDGNWSVSAARLVPTYHAVYRRRSKRSRADHGAIISARPRRPEEAGSGRAVPAPAALRLMHAALLRPPSPLAVEQSSCASRVWMDGWMDGRTDGCRETFGEEMGGDSTSTSTRGWTCKKTWRWACHPLKLNRKRERGDESSEELKYEKEKGKSESGC